MTLSGGDGIPLSVSALPSICLLNHSFHSDTEPSPPRPIRNYVEILRDTLLGFELTAFRKTRTHKAIASAKLYLFDVGVVNALAMRSRFRKERLFGRAFEHFIILELRAYLGHMRRDLPLCYWRSTSQFQGRAV